MIARRLVAALSLVFAVHANPAIAGQGCSEKPLTTATLQSAMSAVQRVTAELDKRGVQVAVLGRIGQDLSKYGLRYSHVGFVYREGPDQPWRIAHLLNDCGSNRSDLWYEGVGNFFLDDLFAYDAVVMVPPPELSQRLLSRLSDAKALRSLHDPDYSLVAYPFSTRYENSNTWVLETIVVSSAKDAVIHSRSEAKAWLKMTGYRPSELEIGAFNRLGGRMFKANVAFDDHPNDLRYSGRIRTVTADSIEQFVKSRNEGWSVFEIAAKP
ncbi:putative outer membrane protein [Candidatus Burkholderia verschuerenii]|uniref:Putative outer membrane protein n=1 Tax=Candidatus Burkholderia verschuerenii TaxID=242163 RepID=A0A0L0MJH6_9BURK|nr:DUF2145 domain-containing protein [Candidatus Burkholderia verschuerenii]KND62446.1 putative outer membrane protein [Candidatus Burkholderia verschuerenii]